MHSFIWKRIFYSAAASRRLGSILCFQSTNYQHHPSLSAGSNWARGQRVCVKFCFGELF